MLCCFWCHISQQARYFESVHKVLYFFSTLVYISRSWLADIWQPLAQARSFLAARQTLLPSCSKVEWRCAGWDRLGVRRRVVSDCFPALLRMGYFCKSTCAGCLVSAGAHKKVEALNEWNALTTLSSVRWLLPAASPLGLAEPALPVPGLAPHWHTSLM